MWWLWMWIGLAVAVPVVLHVAVYFLWAPVKVKRSQHLAARPTFKAVDDGWMTPEMRDFSGAVAGRLAAVGFEPLGSFAIERAVPDVTSAQAILVNRATGDLAVIILTRAALSRSLVYAIRTDFADGTRVSTGYNPSVGVYPRDRVDLSESFPFVEDPAELYEAHRRTLKQSGRATRVRQPLPEPGEGVAYCEWDWQRNMKRPVAIGYYWLDDAAGVYRYTWKGAYLMTWRLAPPVKQWRIALRERRAWRVWARLGMPRTPSPMPAAPAAAAVEPVPVVPVSEAGVAEVPLRYEAGLREGEVHVERGAGLVTVRVGGATPWQALGRQKWRIGTIVLWAALLAMAGRSWWQWHVFMRSLPPNFPRGIYSRVRGPSLTMPLIWLGLLAWEVAALARVLMRARGAAVITATAGGVRFANAAGSRGAGEVARSRIETVKVVPRLLGWKRWAYDLKVREHGGFDVLLATSPDQAGVTAARDAIAQVTGIEVVREAAAAGET